MSDTKLTAVTLCQISDALEERQKSERRKLEAGVPENVNKDRRRTDRREGKVSKKEQ